VFIRKIIQDRLNSSFKIYDREGFQVPREKVRSEYDLIKNYLSNQHINASGCIALNQTKDYRYFLTILSCLELGITYIPLKSNYPSDRIEQIKQDSKFTILFDDLTMDQVLSHPQSDSSELSNLNPQKPAYIIFTSGSTGRPKGVVIQRGALENFFMYLQHEFPKVTNEDRILQVTEFTFDISLVDIGIFLTKNASLYFSNFDNNIFKLGFEIETHRISFLNTVPNNLNMFLSELVAERMDYQCLRHLFIAGARFSHGLYQKCQKYFRPDVDVYNLYGPTESTVYSHGKHLTFIESQDCIDGIVSIGKCLPNVKAHIIVDGKIAGPDTKGELYIGGIQLLKEYVNNPEQTSKSLIQLNNEMFYKSGDLAFRTSDNNFFIIGRVDDTIKYRGFRINLLDIDSYISRINYVEDSVTIAVPCELSDNQTICFLILKEQKSVKEIRQEMGKLLLDYQIPEKIIFTDKYPTNISGKVCRKTLKDQYIESLNKD
jgi:acyl-coenzyme A synthetase/AMP-(fatty) acid ligase